ncbi:MAG: glycosyltransferase family 39 protein [Anaerolineales bacterium]|nr:glycosyltransferase family 39 protein [Anaerolineales bacterium]
MHRRRLWLGMGLLLLAFVIRAHAIQALPPFNDESLHIRRAEGILIDRDLSLTPFKLLTYYVIAFFRPARTEAIFLGRTGIAMLSLVGLSATYATARLLFGQRTAWLALILAICSPFMIFFDRLALADPLTSALAMMVVWLSVVIVRRPEARWSILNGVFMALVILAKTIGAPFLALPVLAIIAFGGATLPTVWKPRPLWQWLITHLQPYRHRLLTAYGTFALSMSPFGLHVLERTLTGRYVMLVNNNLVLGLAEDRPFPEVLARNLGTLWDVNWILHSPALWVVILLSAVYTSRQRPHAALYLIGSVLLGWSMSVVLGAELSTRYLTLGILPMLVMLAGTLNLVMTRLRYGQTLVVMGIGAWIALFAAPFIYRAWTDPTQLWLPPRDRWEYFANFTSGYGLMDAADDIEQLPRSEPSGRVNVFGLNGSCHQIRLYLPNAEPQDDGPVWLECPFFGWYGEFLMDVGADIQERLQVESQVYLLVEPEIPYFDVHDLDPLWNWQEVKRYQRPFDGMEIILYHITPLEGEVP